MRYKGVTQQCLTENPTARPQKNALSLYLLQYGRVAPFTTKLLYLFTPVPIINVLLFFTPL